LRVQAQGLEVEPRRGAGHAAGLPHFRRAVAPSQDIVPAAPEKSAHSHTVGGYFLILSVSVHLWFAVMRYISIDISLLIVFILQNDLVFTFH
jgi:hypothetical protein